MKLEVGMYVRYTITDYQKEWTEIDKINEYVPQTGQLYLKTSVCVKSNVIKASYNIIDLIEVGDYVNGKLVSKISTDYIFDYSEEIKIIYFSEKDYIYSTKDIKSIVTKEQFESISYKVGV